MFAVLAWTAVEIERASGLASLRTDAVAAMHESPFAYLASMSSQQVCGVRTLSYSYGIINSLLCVFSLQVESWSKRSSPVPMRESLDESF